MHSMNNKKIRTWAKTCWFSFHFFSCCFCVPHYYSRNKGNSKTMDLRKIHVFLLLKVCVHTAYMALQSQRNSNENIHSSW